MRQRTPGNRDVICAIATDRIATKGRARRVDIQSNAITRVVGNRIVGNGRGWTYDINPIRITADGVADDRSIRTANIYPDIITRDGAVLYPAGRRIQINSITAVIPDHTVRYGRCSPANINTGTGTLFNNTVSNRNRGSLNHETPILIISPIADHYIVQYTVHTTRGKIQTPPVPPSRRTRTPIPIGVTPYTVIL